MSNRIQYATVQDLEGLCLPAAALEGYSDAEKDVFLLAASGEANDYIRASKDPVYPVPLERWSQALNVHVAAIAAYRLLTHRGYQPQGPDLQLRLLYEDALAYFRRISSGGVKLDIDPPIMPSLTARARVRSYPPRGWGCRRGWGYAR